MGYININIRINTDNNAFADDPLDEVTRIVAEQALTQLRMGIEERTFCLRDYNGNTVGECTVRQGQSGGDYHEFVQLMAETVVERLDEPEEPTPHWLDAAVDQGVRECIETYWWVTSVGGAFCTLTNSDNPDAWERDPGIMPEEGGWEAWVCAAAREACKSDVIAHINDSGMLEAWGE